MHPEDFGSTLGTRLVTSLGFGLYPGVVSPTNRRRLLLERWFVTHSSQEKGADAMVRRTTAESTEVRRDAGRVWGKLGPEPLLSLAERGEAGKQLSRFRIRAFEKCRQAQRQGAGAKLSGIWPFVAAVF